jgi:hypothetical protein
MWKSEPLQSNIPSVHFEKASKYFIFTKWKTHNDWIEQITIDKRLNQIISCSNDEQHAVVIGIDFEFFFIF